RRTTTSEGLRARLMAYQVGAHCPGCSGRRLRPESRSAYVRGLAFDGFMAMTLDNAWEWARQLEAEDDAGVEGARRSPGGKLQEVISGLESRLRFLVQVGLAYLSLDRSYHTLSGGEAQRVRLATQLG